MEGDYTRAACYLEDMRGSNLFGTPGEGGHFPPPREHGWIHTRGISPIHQERAPVIVGRNALMAWRVAIFQWAGASEFLYDVA